MILTALFLILTLPFWLIGMSVISGVQLFYPISPFFVQQRLGKDGTSFQIFKFATLTQSGNAISWWHNWLRKTHLDELPQWINMMKGEMFLIGPRPLPVRYFNRMPETVKQRFEVKPGLTGLAQVNDHAKITWDERFAYDLLYVHQRSFYLDAEILIKTVLNLLSEMRENSEKTQIQEYMGSKTDV